MSAALLRRRARGVACGLLVDRVVGEPPARVHPVAAFGRLMTAYESRLHRDSRPAGVGHAATGAAVGVLAGVAVRSTAIATVTAVAGRSLTDAARSIGDALSAGDVDRARDLLPHLVGRDPAGLDEREISRAVVESLAENTVDAVVAPAVWGLAAGAPGVLAHRAVNTMDAMVGHRSPRHLSYGWASARLDDVAAWVPARFTAALVALARPTRAGSIVRAVRRDAPAHPSPNSGVAEAAFAAALGLGLGGISRYGDRVEHRPELGDGRPAQPSDIEPAIVLVRDVTVLLATGLLALGSVPWTEGCT